MSNNLVNQDKYKEIPQLPSSPPLPSLPSSPPSPPPPNEEKSPTRVELLQNQLKEIKKVLVNQEQILNKNNFHNIKKRKVYRTYSKNCRQYIHFIHNFSNIFEICLNVILNSLI